MSIPCGNICHKPLSHVSQSSEITDAQSLPLEHAKPLLHLVHPGTMHGHKVAHEMGMSRQPGLNQLAFMHLQIIHYKENTSRG